MTALEKDPLRVPLAVLSSLALLYYLRSWHDDDGRWCRFNPESFKFNRWLCTMGVGCFTVAFSKLLARDSFSAQADTADRLFDSLRRIGASESPLA